MQCDAAAGRAAAPPAHQFHAVCAVTCGALEEAKQGFLESEQGASYGYNGWIDQHWQEEVGVRFGPGHHYLDYTGAGQYTTTQLMSAVQELASSAFGNPHSKNPSSFRATQEVLAARAMVLQHFNARPEDYHVIFTKGATEGLKMVGEYFPWSKPDSQPGSSSSSSSSSSSHFVYTQANHKSVLGIGAYAKHAGAQLHCITKDQMDEWLNTSGLPVPETPGASNMNGASSSSSTSCCDKAGSKTMTVLANCSSSALGSAVASPAGSTAVAAAGPVNDLAAARLGKAPSLDELLQPATPQNGSCEAPGEEQLAVHAQLTQRFQPCSAQPEACCDCQAGPDSSSSSSSGVVDRPVCHLVAYPAKDNYEGRLYPLSWVEQVHAKSDAAHQYFVLLDCAAFAATHCLDLSRVQPDFVTLSFYKLFGYPSGLGALLIRKQAAQQLNKVYFGGGSVDYCTAEDAWHVLSEAPAGLEDGTLGFLNIVSLKHGFNQLNALGGMKAISAHVESLRGWTYQQLLQLTHSNGQPLVCVFGHHAEGPTHQGGIFQFQVLTPGGDRVPGSLVEAAATAAGLHLRTGCNCNPGRCLPNLGIAPEEERARAAQGHKGPFLVVLRPKGTDKGASQQPVPGCTADSPTSNSSSSNSSSCSPAQQQQRPEDASNCPLKFAEGEDTVSGCAGAAHETHVPVPLPLGSVRVSLGAYSTFEDCYALIRLLGHTFRDFEVYARDVAAGEKVVTVMDDAEHVVKLRATIGLRGA